VADGNRSGLPNPRNWLISFAGAAIHDNVNREHRNARLDRNPPFFVMVRRACRHRGGHVLQPFACQWMHAHVGWHDRARARAAELFSARDPAVVAAVAAGPAVAAVSGRPESRGDGTAHAIRSIRLAREAESAPVHRGHEAALQAGRRTAGKTAGLPKCHRRIRQGPGRLRLSGSPKTA